MASKQASARVKVKNAPGVYRRTKGGRTTYDVTWRCGGFCDNPDHAKKGDGFHWKTVNGDADLAAAKRLRAAMLRDVDDRRARRERGEEDVVRPSKTFREVADEYMRSRAYARLAPGTAQKYYEALRLRVLPRFGDRDIADITPDDIARWLESMRTVRRDKRVRGGRTVGLSESTINGALTALRVVFKFAIARAQGYITANPVAALDDDERPAPEQDKRPVQVLDDDAIGRLLEHAPADYALILEVGAGTGLRSSELRGLVWGDIDLERKRIVVSRQIDTHDSGQRVRIKDRALNESRAVPLTDALTDKLRDLHAARAEHDLARPDAFVFGRAGRHVPNGDLYAAFNAAVDAAGIERDPDRRLSPHALRHSWGSRLLASGEQLSNVSAWLGHRRINTTERWYAHQIESHLDLAAERMRERAREREEARA
jgi:integrase